MDQVLAKDIANRSLFQRPITKSNRPSRFLVLAMCSSTALTTVFSNPAFSQESLFGDEANLAAPPINLDAPQTSPSDKDSIIATRRENEPDGGFPTLIRLEPIASNQTHPPVVTALAMTRDRRLLIAAGDDHALRVIDLKSGTTLKTLDGHLDWVRSVGVAADGSWILSCGNDGTLRRWDVENGSSKILFRSPVALMTMTLDPQQTKVACAGFGNQLWVIDLQSDELIKTITLPSQDQRALAFSTDGSMLACGGRDGCVRIWKWQTEENAIEQQLHRERIRSVKFSNGDQVVTTIGEDRRLIRYDFVRGQIMLDRKIIGGKLLSMTDVNDKTIAVAGSDNTIRWIDVDTGAELQRLIGHDGSVAVMLCDGKTLISGSFDTTIRTWNLSLAKGQSTLEYEHPVSARFHDSGVSEKLR